MNRPLSNALIAFLALSVGGCTTETIPQVEILGTSALLDRFEGSEWSAPVHLDAPVNSASRELAAQLSPDELSLYFGSDRPGGLGAFDIWVSRRACLDCPWEEPANLGPNINSAGGDGAPDLSRDGMLLFFSGSRAGGFGGEDIWMSRRTDPNDDLSWQPAVNLGPMVNTGGTEGSPAYVPALGGEGANLYFARNGDLFRVRVSRDGDAPDAAEAVTELNHPTATDSEAAIRGDGKEIYFWSTRPGLGGADIWVSRRNSANEAWSTPVNLAAINTPFADLTPALSHDGRTLLFSAGFQRGGLGFQDIWMSTRRESR